MRIRFSLALFSLLVLIFTATSQQLATAANLPDDPYLWLEEVESARALDWVAQENKKTLSELESDPSYSSLLDDARGLYLAQDRVSFGTYSKGHFWNFWQDKDHPQGQLRWASYTEYKRKNPRWKVVIDLDELSKRENRKWVYKGYVPLGEGSRVLIMLSDGGKDAVVLREFDWDTREFVEDGFVFPEGKMRAVGIDRDRVLIATDFGDGSMTASGYPRILKLMKRGEALETAQTVFEALPTDLSVSAHVYQDGVKYFTAITRQIDFYRSETFIEGAGGIWNRVPIPRTAAILGLKKGYIYVQLKRPARGGSKRFRENTILRIPMDAKNLKDAEVIFRAKSGQSIEDVDIHSDRVIVTLLDNVRSRAIELKKSRDGFWQERPLALPSNGVLGVELRDKRVKKDDRSFVTYTDHLTPYSQYEVNDRSGEFELKKIKSSVERFDASKFEVVQNFAVSSDGTKIPYFVLKAKDLVYDGKNPTILYGYGGFEYSLTPSYSGLVGKLWLERGGVYVIANIRGGGEFGPKWHQAALKEKRQVAFDDFIAVAEDLVSRKIAEPRHLGIWGGSNGGLLTGTTMVQRPDLFNAALVQVPLLDMARFSKLFAGHSWVGEYGDPEVAKECEYLLSYSPYHNVKPNEKYPTPLFTTSTKDDRVHPAHARKMAARMRELGHPYYFYESSAGGHAGAMGLEESAHLAALEFTYFWKRLK